MLTFDAPTHTYRLGDRVLPGVTSILDRGIASYAGVPRHILDAAADRGTYVHRACELLLWDSLDWDSLVPEFRPYVDAFARFLQESGVDPELPEERVWHRKLFYAGTADLICRLAKRKKFRRAVIDFKTSFRLMPAVGPQLAAYQEAYNSGIADKGEHALDRYALHLRKDGTYQLQPYESPMDMAVFRACLTIHNFTAKEQRHERSKAA